jgi:hypothetical protein
MNACIRPAIAGLFVLLLPVLAQAGPPKLVFSGGTVSIDADAVPLRAILEEWARVGGTGIDGIDQLPEAVITLHVAGSAEEEVLDALLKGRNGYATVRKKPGEAGASELARIAVFSATTLPGTAGATPSAVPADWPFPVNENPEVDTTPPAPATLESVGIPGIDVPWPFPVNLEATLQAESPAPAAVTKGIPGAVTTGIPGAVTTGNPGAVTKGIPAIDAPWPFPINLNPVDDPEPIDAPVTEEPQ